MINLEFTGMCEGCNRSELRLTKEESFNGERVWFINCEHRLACLRMAGKQYEAEGRPRD